MFIDLQVVCCLCACKYGLSEEELLEFLSIPSHVWVPFHFALDGFLIEHSGLLRLAYSELRDAVHDRYMKDAETRERYAREILGFFQKKYDQASLFIKNICASVEQFSPMICFWQL
jgi:hypothetical protein